MDMTKALLLDSATGAFMSDEHRRVAEIVHDYNPELKVVFVPAEKRQFNDDQPFALVHTPSGGMAPYVVRRLAVNELNAGLIAWIFKNDQARTNVGSILDTMWEAEQALKLKKEMASREQANEMANAIIGSPLNTYRHDGVTYR
jgi:hypothetical protein